MGPNFKPARRHACKSCGERFTNPANLRRHRRSRCHVRGEAEFPPGAARPSKGASWGPGIIDANPPNPQRWPFALHPSPSALNGHARLLLGPSMSLSAVFPQPVAVLQDPNAVVVQPLRLPLFGCEPPNAGVYQGPQPWSAISLRPDPNFKSLEVGHFILATTEGPLEIVARFEHREGKGPFLSVDMPNACGETVVAVRRGACAGLWLVSDVLRRCTGRELALPLPLSECLQHSTLHVSLRFPVLRPTGSSIGLPVALAVLSLCTGQPCTTETAATGRVYLDGSLSDVSVSGLRQKAEHLVGSGCQALIVPAAMYLQSSPFPLQLAHDVLAAASLAFHLDEPFKPISQTSLYWLVNAKLSTMKKGGHTTVGHGGEEGTCERFDLPRAVCKTFTCRPLSQPPSAQMGPAFDGGQVTCMAVMVWEGPRGVTVLPQLEQETLTGPAVLAVGYLEAHRHTLPCAKPGMQTWNGLEVVVDVVGREHSYTLGLDDGGAVLVALLSAYTGLPIKNQGATAVLVGLHDEHGSLIHGFGAAHVAHADALVTQLVEDKIDTLIVGAGAAHSLRAAVGQRNLRVLGVHTVEELLFFTLPQLIAPLPLLFTCLPTQIHIFELPAAQTISPLQHAESRRQQLLDAVESGGEGLQRLD